MWRPRLIGLALIAVTIVPAVLFISDRQLHDSVAFAFCIVLAASIVLMCRGFRENPCVFGAVLVFVVNPLVGQVFLLWCLRCVREVQSYF